MCRDCRTFLFTTCLCNTVIKCLISPGGGKLVLRQCRINWGLNSTLWFQVEQQIDALHKQKSSQFKKTMDVSHNVKTQAQCEINKHKGTFVPLLLIRSDNQKYFINSDTGHQYTCDSCQMSFSCVETTVNMKRGLCSSSLVEEVGSTAPGSEPRALISHDEDNSQKEKCMWGPIQIRIKLVCGTNRTDAGRLKLCSGRERHALLINIPWWWWGWWWWCIRKNSH